MQKQKILYFLFVTASSTLWANTRLIHQTTVEHASKETFASFAQGHKTYLGEAATTVCVENLMDGVGSIKKAYLQVSADALEKIHQKKRAEFKQTAPLHGGIILIAGVWQYIHDPGYLWTLLGLCSATILANKALPSSYSYLTKSTTPEGCSPEYDYFLMYEKKSMIIPTAQSVTSEI